LGNEPYLVELGRVSQEYQRDDQTKRNPDDVLLQASSLLQFAGPALKP
jgi:hypothetical protein